MTADLMLTEIDRMSVPDKLALLERLWDSLPEAVDAEDVPASHIVELEKRLARADANPGEGKPWREVFERLEKKR